MQRHAVLHGQVPPVDSGRPEQRYGVAPARSNQPAQANRVFSIACGLLVVLGPDVLLAFLANHFFPEGCALVQPFPRSQLVENRVDGHRGRGLRRGTFPAIQHLRWQSAARTGVRVMKR